jgi:hypothetical protein
VIPSELPRVINEAEDALLLLGREVYQRGGMLVRPVRDTSKSAATAKSKDGNSSK